MSENTLPGTDDIEVQAVPTFAVNVSAPPRLYAADVSSGLAGPPGPEGPAGPQGPPGPPGFPIYDDCGTLTDWTRATGTPIVVATVTDSVVVGGKVFQSAGPGNPAYYRNALIPFDPNALYRIRFRVRQTVDHAQNFFNGGLEGVAADGVTSVNVSGADSHYAQHYMMPNKALTVAQGWQEFTGYYKGTAAAGTTYTPTTPTSPGKMHEATRYIRPTFFTNYNAGTGTQEIDYVSVEVVPPIATAASAEITFAGDGGTTPLSAALTGAVSGKSLTVADGDVILGDDAETVARQVIFRRLVSGTVYEDQVRCGGASMAVYGFNAGVQAVQFSLRHDGSIRITTSPDLVDRPIPFAMAAKAVSVTLSAAVSGSAVWTFPTGRFTQTPIVVATSTNANYHAQVFGLSATQVSIMLRHVDNVTSSGTFPVHCQAIQLTPTSSEG